MNNIKNPFEEMHKLDKTRKRKIAFYGRVSTEHEEQLDALQNQLQWYDDQLSHNPNWVLYNKYIDKGITGTQAKKRPAFLEMIEDAKQGKFDLIVTREVSRFARNTVDTLEYTRLLKYTYNVEVYFVIDNIWTFEGDGELRLTIMATMAQDESRKMSERVRAGQKISRDNGVLYGTGNILGYDRVGDRYVINNEQAATVRKIFNLYLSGKSMSQIRDQLIKDGDKTAMQGTWSTTNISRILHKSTYCGVIAYGQSYNNGYLEQKRFNNCDRDSYMYKESDLIPPIISKADFDRVQKIIESRKQTQLDESGNYAFRYKPRNKKTNIWLKKLKCGCGSSVRMNHYHTSKISENGERIRSYCYECYNKINYGSPEKRLKKGLPESDKACGIKLTVDWKLNLMSKKVMQCIFQDNKAVIQETYDIIESNYVNPDAVDEKKLKTYKDNLKKLMDKKNRLINMRADDEISKEEYTIFKKNIESDIYSLETTIKEYSSIQNDPNKSEHDLKHIKESLETIMDFTKDKIDTDLIDEFIYQIIKESNDRYIWIVNLSKNNIDDIMFKSITMELKGNQKLNSISFIQKDDSVQGNLQANSNNDTGCYSREISIKEIYL